MYELVPRNRRAFRPLPPSGLGFALPTWLTPPRVIRDAFGRAVQVIEDKAATAIERAAGQVSFTPSPKQQVEQVVGQVPGGWGTIAAVGAGVVLLVMMSGRRSR